MSRQIKFRVWNGMEMIYEITAGVFGVFYVNPENGDGLNPKDSASLTANTTKYHEGTPLMQFAGMKDKNGKEIYEGDIVRYWGGVAPIEYNIFGFAIKETDGDYFDINEPDKIEVIGNIYENNNLISK